VIAPDVDMVHLLPLQDGLPLGVVEEHPDISALMHSRRHPRRRCPGKPKRVTDLAISTRLPHVIKFVSICWCRAAGGRSDYSCNRIMYRNAVAVAVLPASALVLVCAGWWVRFSGQIAYFP
jgi:hypothetical protein